MVEFISDGNGGAKARYGYYIEGESSPRYSETKFGSDPIWVVYHLHVEIADPEAIEGVDYTQTEAAHLLHEANVSFGVKVDADAAVNFTQEEIDAAQSGDPAYEKTTSDVKTPASRAKFYPVAGTTAVAPTTLTSVHTNSITPRASALVDDNTYEWDYYFGMYIDGSGVNDGNTAPNGNITVSFL